MPQTALFIAAKAFAVKVLTAKAIGYVLLRTVLVNFALSKVSSLLAGKPKQAGATGQQVTVRDSVMPRQIIYGEVKTSGGVVFYGTTGARNQFLWYVVALAGHQCEDITDVWLDNEQITDGQIDAGTGAVTAGKFAGKVYVWRYLGTSSQTANADLIAATGLWTSNHRGAGVAYLIFRLELDQNKFPQGAPQNFYAMVKGRRVYDPRLDSTNGGSGAHRLADPSTWAWSANPALCVADYITGGSQWFDTSSITQRLGLRVATSRVDWAQVAAAANRCDTTAATPGPSTQTRYVTGCVLSCASTHQVNRDRLEAAMIGETVYTGGKYRVFAGGWDAPTLAFTDADVSGGYDFVGGLGKKDRFNAVSGVYVDPQRDWNEVTCAVQTSSAYEAEDGERRLVDIDLTAVTDEWRAQRICAVHNRRGRDQATIKIGGTFNWLKLAPYETFALTLAEQGWVGKTFRAQEISIDLAARRIEVTAKEETAASWTDLTVFGDAASGSGGNTYEIPPPPVAFQAVPQVDGILFQWPASTPFLATWDYEIWEYTSASSLSSASRIWAGKATQALIPKTDTTVRYYWLVINAQNDQYGDSTPAAATGMPAAASSVSGGFRATADPTAVYVSTTSSSGTTGACTITPVNGAPGYTYAWTRLSGDASTTISSSTSAAPTWTRTGMAVDTDYVSTWRCTITDSASATTTVDVVVDIARISYL